MARSRLLRAASLYGGQRQRLALARAPLTEPVILLLDEATSSFDAKERVARALAEQRCTRIVIAHRLSTVAAANQILVLEDGALVVALLKTVETLLLRRRAELSVAHHGCL